MFFSRSILECMGMLEFLDVMSSCASFSRYSGSFCSSFSKSCLILWSIFKISKSP